MIEENVKVVSFEKTKYGREKGYLGDKCLLENIKYVPEASTTTSPPNSIFVKMFPTDMVVPPGAIASMFKNQLIFLYEQRKNCLMLTILKYQVYILLKWKNQTIQNFHLDV